MHHVSSLLVGVRVRRNRGPATPAVRPRYAALQRSRRLVERRSADRSCDDDPAMKVAILGVPGSLALSEARLARPAPPAKCFAQESCKSRARAVQEFQRRATARLWCAVGVTVGACSRRGSELSKLYELSEYHRPNMGASSANVSRACCGKTDGCLDMRYGGGTVPASDSAR